MKITAKKNVKPLKLPLPIYESIHLADTVSENREQFSIFIGLAENMVIQLKTLSLDKNDVELQSNTPDLERFAEGAYEKWYQKIRTPFVLVHKNTSTLAAIIWFGPRKLNDKEGDWHTVAWRSYNPWRGKGLMKSFGYFAINFYLKYFPDVKLWITAKKENTGSLRLAEALGFRSIESIREKGFLEMVKEP